MFVTGLLGFSAASALCGAAPTIGVLIAARALLGLAWRSVFLVNVPVGLAAAVAALRVLPADRPEAGTRLDLGGVGLLVAALALLAVPLLEGRSAGWPAWAFASLVLAVPAWAAFAAYERRVDARGGAALVPPRLFRNRSFAGGIPIALLFMLSYAGFLLLLAIYLQAGLHFSPLHAGAVYTPSAVGFFLASLAAPRLVPLLGRHVLTVGYVVAALGLLGAAGTVAAAGAELSGWELGPTLFVAGIGQGLGLSPLVGTIISGLAPEEAGSGAGVVTTTLQAGNVLGVGLGGLGGGPAGQALDERAAAGDPDDHGPRARGPGVRRGVGGVPARGGRAAGAGQRPAITACVWADVVTGTISNRVRSVQPAIHSCSRAASSHSMTWKQPLRSARTQLST